MAKLPARQAGLSKLLLLLIILVVIFLASGTALGLYFMGVFDSDGTEEVVAEEGEAEDGDAEGDEVVEAEAEAEAPVEPVGPPIYIPLEPPLVVNFDRNGRVGFLQVNLQLMTRQPGLDQEVVNYLPVIRNNLLLMFGSKTYADIADRAGKEALRAEALAEVNRILSEGGVKGKIEELYFTGFVMQ